MPRVKFGPDRLKTVVGCREQGTDRVSFIYKIMCKQTVTENCNWYKGSNDSSIIMSLMGLATRTTRSLADAEGLSNVPQI